VPARPLDAPRWRIQYSATNVLIPKDTDERTTSTAVSGANIPGRPAGGAPAADAAGEGRRTVRR